MCGKKKRAKRSETEKEIEIEDDGVFIYTSERSVGVLRVNAFWEMTRSEMNKQKFEFQIQ